MKSQINVAINGFGRIGRITLRRLLTMPEINVVAINDLTDSATLSHLFKYDSVHGKYQGTVKSSSNAIVIDGKEIPITAFSNIEQLPWSKYQVDVVIEATGLKKHLTEEFALKHIEAGAKKVILSAPASSGDVKTIVVGVNDNTLNGEELVISNASCTTNCLTPMLKILDEQFGIAQGMISTIHAYTADQKLQDAPHADLRRARAAAQAIIPTSTGANKAVTQVLPHLKGKIEGSAYRVPVIDGSLLELNMVLERNVSKEELNAAFKTYAETSMKGILEYCEDPIVSVDIISNPSSCIYDAELTLVAGKFVKLVGWYDNEFGYSNRLAELTLKFATINVANYA